MGRAKTRSKQKSAVPIAFPHDGPLFHIMMAAQLSAGSCEMESSDNYNASPQEEASAHQRWALRILKGSDDELALRLPPMDTLSTDDEWMERIVSLCGSLRKPTTTAKEQLNELQQFRNKLVQGIANDQMDKPDSVQFHSTSSVWGLYRLLLEWSLSYQTPLPFQRAIQSLLKTIRQANNSNSGDDDDDAVSRETDIDCIVLSSIVSNRDDIRSPWQDPLHSLDVAVNNPSLSALLCKEPLLDDCLQFAAQSPTVSSILQEIENTQMDAFQTQQQQTEQALQLASTLKTLLRGVDLPESAADGREVLSLLQVNVRQLQHFAQSLLASSTVPTEGFNALGILYGQLLCLDVALDPETIDKMQSLATSCVNTIASLHDNDNLSPLGRLSMVQGIAATIPGDALVYVADASSPDSSTPLYACWRYSLDAGKYSTEPLVRWAALKGLATLISRQKQQQQLVDGEAAGYEQRPQSIRLLVDETLELVFESWENPPLRKIESAISGLFRSIVQTLPQQQIEKLFQQVLAQPVNRKGRYVALDVLLPYISVSGITKSGGHVMESEMAVPVDSLLEGIGDQGPNAGAIADLWMKVLILKWGEMSNLNEDLKEVSQEAAFTAWKSHWITPFCRAILQQSLVRRKQTTALCLPRVVEFMRSEIVLKERVPCIFSNLIEGIRKAPGATQSHDRLWALLELCRHVHTMGISSSALNDQIAKAIPMQVFRDATVYSISDIRLAAYKAIEPVASAHSGLDSILEEINVWKYALPFSGKSNDSKEYRSSLLQCLCQFLDRLILWEDKGLSNDATMSAFLDFTKTFLIEELFLAKSGYPGSVAEKESFGIALLECLLTFLMQDGNYSEDNIFPQNSAIFSRYRSPCESEAIATVLLALLSDDIFSSLVAFLHSIWDNTRRASYSLLVKLVFAAQSRGLHLPEGICSKESHDLLLSRGIFLASSPRQREADSGSRMLALIHASLSIRSEKSRFLTMMADIMDQRIGSMKRELRDLLSGASCISGGSALPLAHGFAHACRLCVLQERTSEKLHIKVQDAPIEEDLYARMIELLCQGLQLSLSVVADVRDGEDVNGLDEYDTAEDEIAGDSTPLNVNTGAIGANGTFSSVATTDENEKAVRHSTQRVVIGTWLLTKEACAAVATLLTLSNSSATRDQFTRVGQLLLSTLTCLKHAGAAFAARDALQQITSFTFSPNAQLDIHSLPIEWSNRLLDEISLTEKVRNSTLRRSTGYALGFMAIMRAEAQARSQAHVTTKVTLDRLLALSLPPTESIHAVFARLKMQPIQLSTVSHDNYEDRCRIHALNILRMLILDAPLSTFVNKIAGYCIVSAILGYSDTTWAIRNSSTMVFAATMLKVIDADKNAYNSDKTSSTAISITELFRRYPPLSGFLSATLRDCVEEIESTGEIKTQMFPVLSLLSRVQSVVEGNVSASLSTDFLPLLLRCLGCKDYYIRQAAARAISTLCPECQRRHVQQELTYLLKLSTEESKPDWNKVDGFLLTAKALYRRDQEAHSGDFDILIVLARGNIPPTCRSTALSIMALHSKNAAPETERICQQVICLGNVVAMYGASHLYREASEILCTVASSKVFFAEDEGMLSQGISMLQKLFTNSLYDVRLYSVKYFKKGIYNNFDKVLERPVSTKVSTISSHLFLLLLECAVAESKRDQEESAGTHIPTLRRLTRCLLEILSYGTVDISPEEADCMWNLSCGMISRDIENPKNDFNDEEILFSGVVADGSGANLVSANAVEMMAFAGTCSPGTMIQSRLDKILRVIGQFNNPCISWRCRYSAVIALKRCCCLGDVLDTDFHLVRPLIVRYILSFLQDSDPDVRDIAARAATEYCNDARVEGGATLLPEWTLHEVFPLVFDQTEKIAETSDVSHAAEELLQVISDNSFDLIPTMDRLLIEFRRSDRGYLASIQESGDDFVNVDASRKIFEDEDPNPFQEKALLSQLAIRSLLEMFTTGHTLDISSSSNVQQLVKQCQNALGLLHDSEDAGGLVHELSRFPSVFPSLSSVIICTAVLCQFVEPKDSFQNMRGLAAQLTEHSPYLHPTIHDALLVLQEEQASIESFQPLLFLL